jgi:hypothetical protein
VKLDPTAEEEEDLATDVVFDRKDSAVVEHIERVYLDLDDDGASTLVGAEVGEKEVDMEIEESEDEEEVGLQDEGGLQRKRTIRVIIRSRAFL